MNILLTNDDGINAPGLVAAYEAIKALGNVYVVAPKHERSACGHAITLKGPIIVERHDHPVFGRAFSVDGSPADCVRLAISHLVGRPIDLTISGINQGANAGVDTYYSGTIAAARESAFLGVKSMAFSHATRKAVPLDWPRAAELTTQIARDLLNEELPGPGFWSVNFPAPLPANGSVKICRVPISKIPMPMVFEQKSGSADHIMEFDYMNPYWERQAHGPCDYTTIRGGDIAITAIPLFGQF